MGPRSSSLGRFASGLAREVGTARRHARFAGDRRATNPEGIRRLGPHRTRTHLGTIRRGTAPVTGDPLMATSKTGMARRARLERDSTEVKKTLSQSAAILVDQSERIDQLGERLGERLDRLNAVTSARTPSSASPRSSDASSALKSAPDCRQTSAIPGLRASLVRPVLAGTGQPANLPLFFTEARAART